ncbi:hypothetical protein AGMMS49941_08180 [Deferribacterales bacterium]|nr:hypothetical protein AGMMS49941_08180 [Deferribacterales bacterium]
MDYMKRCVERDVLESKENKSDEPIVLITGDSYAETQFPLWEKLSRGSGKRIDFFMCFGAIPGMRLEDSRLSINQDRCMHLLEQAVREDNIADFVITLKLATRLIGWTAYERNTHPDETEYYYITENELKGLSALENGLEQTIKLVKQYHKGARVWLQMQPPEFPFNVSDHADKNKDTKMLRKNYNERVKPIIEILNKFGENLHLIDLASRLCDDTYCYGVIDGTVMYIDHDHISPEGGLKLIELYEPIFANH